MVAKENSKIWVQQPIIEGNKVELDLISRQIFTWADKNFPIW